MPALPGRARDDSNFHGSIVTRRLMNSGCTSHSFTARGVRYYPKVRTNVQEYQNPL